MGFALVLIILVVGSVLFHFLSPWTMTPLASNWGSIDITLAITLIITGVVFIAINFFIAYAVIKFRHQPDRKADYQPENKKLEWWLTLGTSLGIIAMLAPGLIVYADFVNVPEEAYELEIVGQQWSWGFRFPGEDGRFGKSDIRHIAVDNPFGINPLDEAGQDDRLISSNQILLPVDRPVKMLMRSKDVLHDFYIPHFRVKMDMVPGHVSQMWLTPTRTGDFEILCAEFCGVGHFNMRGYLKVVEQQEFDSWLANQTTFSQSLDKEKSLPLSVQAKEGQQLAQSKGCLACHGFTDSQVGPGWQNLYGATRTMADGEQVKVDDSYLSQSILQPSARVVQGYAPIMPKLELSELEVQSIIAYIRERGTDKPAQQGGGKTGQDLAQGKGCLACHSIDGTPGVGPTWQGLYGKEVQLASGETVQADREYLKESIFQPNARVVAGFQPVMPPMPVSEAEAGAIIDYIQSLPKPEGERHE
ncbi:cytochrome c oxidase subunit II [Bowmanella dokdonensis]|uniref:cytochrome-c oxidase n=1 Tax=Bowmanella dokdonensis TaxID=751969 RepID=A0A939IPT3_9ALTE|nr:cytochrome c oxidase subunit II [Bowmanella dokdonensis]MBN7826200.1 c-type cytochrome [Bowmanella dokdonensis]